MYGNEPPTRLRVNDLQLLATCPASGGSPSEMSTAHLDRWKAVVEAIGEWYRREPGSENVEEVEDLLMDWLDPVQRQIASKLFATYRQIMPKAESEQVDVEQSYSEVWDKERNATISSACQLAITSETGTDLVKIKTGRSPLSREEKAILLEGADDSQAGILEVNVMSGEINTVESEQPERQQTIARLFAIPEEARGSKGTVPGLHCYRCRRPSRCGQYPSLEPKLKGAESRTVLVSKKWLTELGICQRKVAWARLYGIPTDEGDTEDDDRTHLGSSFHIGLASALRSDDPDAAFSAYVTSVPGSEQAELLQLWDNHKRLVESEPDPVTVRETEYGIGLTCHAPGPYVDSRGQLHEDRIVAVTFAGFADAVGREADGTPAVVEIRTGATASLPLEPELYALGAHLLTNRVPVAVHTHQVGKPDNLTCDRRLFGEAELRDARQAFDEAAAVVAGWHPENSLSPPFSAGDWCSWCDFRQRCQEFR